MKTDKKKSAAPKAGSKKTKTGRQRVVHSAAQKSADGWISCAPSKKSYTASSGEAAAGGTSLASFKTAKRRISDAFAPDPDDSPTLFSHVPRTVAGTYSAHAKKDQQERQPDVE